MDLTNWLEALERRHLADLTRPEVHRALRALSSCYVERRGKLARGAALEGAGKRAAFALFYGPLHFLTITEIVRALGAAPETRVRRIQDLGCGTGVGGAAWAVACGGRPAVTGVDRSAWAVGEANWTYQTLGIRGRANVGDIVRRFPATRVADHQILLAYAVNELPDAARAQLLHKIADAVRAGAGLLVVEAIAIRDKTWWPEWTSRLAPLGAREDEWRFPAILPPLVRLLAKGAGLDPRELTARSLYRV